jgi:hypothetical protein
VTTGAGGYYSALVPPSNYTVVIDQVTGPAGGEKYQASLDRIVLPAADADHIDLQPVKRVEVSGTVSGGGLKAQLKFEGPEEATANTSSGRYSIYLLPGTYTVYATSTLGSVQYANITSVDVSISSRQHDIQLSKAHLLAGVAMVGGSAATKQVTITAESSSGPVIHSKSNSNGVYSLALPSGTYTVSFVLEDLMTQGSQRLYVEYYGQDTVTMDSSDRSLSPALQVRMDNTTLSGTVSGPDGMPVQAVVELSANGVFGMSTSFVTGSAGEFSESVQPGDYTAVVSRLQDNRVAILKLSLSRNVPLQSDITIYDGRTISGVVTASGIGVELGVQITSGNSKITTQTDASGAFEIVLPPANYTLTTSTSRTESGLTISYTGSERISVDKNNMFIDFALTRNSRYSLSTSWNKSFTQTALPGVPVTYTFQLLNTGNSVDSYTFTYTGTATDFSVSFPYQGFALGFGSNNEVNVPVVVTATDTVSAGNTKIAIQVKSQSSSSTRSDLSLYLDVGVARGVLIYDLGSTEAVNSLTTETKFSLNNTGNAQDNFALEITNLNTLRSLGWSAEIVDPDNGNVVPSVGMPAFFTTPVSVKFTAIRENPDPTAEATVLAYSTNDPGVNTYASLPVNLPDLSVGLGNMDATRSDVSYTYDVSIVAVDVALLVIVAALAVGIFYLRRKKGLGGKGKTGGAKK